MGWRKEMRTRDWPVLIWAGVLVIGVVLLVTWPIAPWADWCWSGQTAAAWVQAVGSIVAILGTAGGLVWQHRRQVAHARRVQLEEELRRYEALHATLINTANLCRRISNRTTKAVQDDPVGFRVAVLEDRRELSIYARAVNEARPLDHDRGVVGMALLRVAVILDALDITLAHSADRDAEVIEAAFHVHMECDNGHGAITNYSDAVRIAISEITKEIERT